MKMCEDFAPNFGDKNWMLHHDNAPSRTSLFTREFFTKNNTTAFKKKAEALGTVHTHGRGLLRG
jgi:hypothetical protein